MLLCQGRMSVCTERGSGNRGGFRGLGGVRVADSNDDPGGPVLSAVGGRDSWDGARHAQLLATTTCCRVRVVLRGAEDGFPRKDATHRFARWRPGVR